MEVSLCIPTLNRYDLLVKTLESAEIGTLKPDCYYIIDNGGSLKLDFPRTTIYRPSFNLGVAASWNYFNTVAPEIRIICNDDIIFYPNTIELLVKNFDPNAVTYPGGIHSTNSFSCFVLPNNILDSIGYFDEWISPQYAYFEDNDYARRMELSGFSLKPVEDAQVNHYGSATLKTFNSEEMEEHHKKFRDARDRYIKKWGGLPREEKYSTPYNR
jgi:GT2 family glycosyltransferase